MIMMLNKQPRSGFTGRQFCRVALAGAVLLSTLAFAPSQAWAKQGTNKYAQTNLVSDVPGLAAVEDPVLINPWGMSFSDSSPFWVSDNGTGFSTLYSVTNGTVTKVALTVAVPGDGVTGQVFSGGTFAGDNFLFVTEDGTISGWRSSLGTNAEVLATRDGAIYMGATVAQTANGPMLLVANFSEATIDVYDTNVTLIAQLSDTNAPEGYGPFNVQALGDKVYVAYAKLNEEKTDEVVGKGFGLVDILDPDSGQFQRLATGKGAGGRLKDINAPWGLAIAPATFGKHSGELLVGNFGSGTIMTFDPQTGDYHGLLKNSKGKNLVIEGLWALKFGNGGRGGDPAALYFTAGIDDEAHGLFGGLKPFTKPHGGGMGSGY
jgi:uncharacterized protein (TIGR03118 family)